MSLKVEPNPISITEPLTSCDVGTGVPVQHGVGETIPLRRIGEDYLNKFSQPKPYRLHEAATLDWEKLDTSSRALLIALVKHYCRSQHGFIEVTNYRTEGKNRIYNDLKEPKPYEIDLLIEGFRNNPRDAFAVFRRNLTAICLQTDIPDSYKIVRLSKYYDASIKLTLILDSLAFQPIDVATTVVRAAPPNYIPNGFLDLGTNKNEEAHLRNREKLLADKGALMALAKPMMLAGLLEACDKYSDQNMLELKRRLTLNHASWLVLNMEYDYDGQFEPLTAPVNENLEIGEGVCRHFALLDQLLNQQMGLSSRLFKADFSIENPRTPLQGNSVERHAANAVLLENNWYVLDVTHSDRSGLKVYKLDREFNVQRPFTMQPITYRFERENGFYACYEIKSDGYWRIRPLAKLEE